MFHPFWAIIKENQAQRKIFIKDQFVLPLENAASNVQDAITSYTHTQTWRI
jgi:hypothetical protein